MVTWFELGENDKNQMLYSMKVPRRCGVGCARTSVSSRRGHQSILARLRKTV
ncbi:type VI secretion system Vgr family protein [Escherichia coli P0304777.2]|nr:type VI secretion system Vgr family protein [Escherichia coli P0304777.2]